ncbi:hypothetical protein QUA00_08215 [Microcoleus sp. T2B6]
MPVPQSNSTMSGTGILPVHNRKMPVPQSNSTLVEQASCLFLKMVQDVS